MKENVVWFEIPMHDIVLVQDLECFKQLPEYLQRLLLAQFDLLLESMFECASVAEFIDKVEVVWSF